MANLDMLAMATAAIEKGMPGSSLQSEVVQVLKKLVNQLQDFSNDDKDAVVSFHSAMRSMHLSQVCCCDLEADS